MRGLVLIWVFMMFWPAAVWAGPAELPPPDFTSAQYIDSKGCVFLRQGRGWTARLDAGGAPVCGFPPSRSAWLAHDDMNTGQPAALERDLTVMVLSAAGTRPDLGAISPDTPVGPPPAPPAAHGLAGQMASDAARQDVPAAPPAEGIAAEVARDLAARPLVAMRTIRNAGPDSRFCVLLGMADGQAPGGSAAGLSGDLCDTGAVVADPAGAAGGRQAPAQAAKGGAAKEAAATGAGDAIVAAARAASAAAPGAAQAPGAAPAPGAKTRPGPAPQRPPGATVPGQPVPRNSAAAPGSGDGVTPAIPANARYIQIGRFNPDGVMATIAALHAMGYPVARERRDDPADERLVLAGPFETQDMLIAALDRLRKAGYRAAVPR
ncbi:MAG: hypothetical protein Q4G25_00020 [Paracoccus sp. (in: a-proteobacteria)]|nr:hypothetical protein [Paracoccus sp. (in: a-proteobacteria)]